MRPEPDDGPDAGARNRRRLEAWRRSGDLRDLWPDVSAGALREAHREIRNATGTVLAAGFGGGPEGVGPGGPGPLPLAEVAGGGDGGRALGVAAFTSGMGPLLGRWIEEGTVDASGEVRGLFARHLDHGRRRSALLRGELVRIVGAMRSRGVDPVVLKGLHTGAAFFPEPGTRPAADIDLLVHPGERPRAAEALAAAGFTEGRRTSFARRSEWVPAGASRPVRSLELDHADNPWSVDLHTGLERWYFRGLRRDLGGPSSGSSDRFAVEGASLWGLGQPRLTAFLALHASYELVKVQLVRLVELVLVVRRDMERRRLRWDDFAALVDRTGTGRFVQPALALAEEVAPGTVDGGLLQELGRGATERTRRVLDAVRAADLAPLLRRSMDAKLMWARGPRELLLNLSELILPSDDGLPVGLGRLQWSRLVALARGAAGWRAGAGVRHPGRP
ncbi:MAG TPA: nucleotidyltransferase family protein [Longimicrobiales bacterium]|nr:nucleotidyltransferase family protein [Longimicrobiales bacterium]